MNDPYGVLKVLQSVKEDCETKGCEAEWFLFGSFLDCNSAPSDIDLLVIATGDECMDAIRVEVEDLVILFPVELLIMSRAEEEELNFITVTRAQKLSDICEE